MKANFRSARLHRLVVTKLIKSGIRRKSCCKTFFNLTGKFLKFTPKMRIFATNQVLKAIYK